VKRHRAWAARPIPREQLKGFEATHMKTLVSTGAIALLLTLTACGPSTPATKKVDKNTNQPAAGSIKSPTQELKEKMSSADGAAAASAGGAPKKP
jgi:hypothetical protein